MRREKKRRQKRVQEAREEEAKAQEERENREVEAQGGSRATREPRRGVRAKWRPKMSERKMQNLCMKRATCRTDT